MARIEKLATINVPTEILFDYISHPGNWPEFWPSLVAVTEVQLLPSGGYSTKWLYKMVGTSLEGTSEQTEVIPNQRIVTETKLGVTSTITWIFKPAAGRTILAFTVEYNIPIPLLGKLAEAIIVRMNESEADFIMSNLKLRFMMHTGRQKM
jgi:uncharacterized protein YndB with AHSA1/START domain